MQTELMGTPLFYVTRGLEEPGIPVLFLHGWGCTHEVFSPLMEALSLPEIAMDFPGHGESGEPATPWGIPEYAEQVLQLLDFLGVPRVRIVAHSFGGRVALWLSSHAPERVERMVLTGAAGIRPPQSEKKTKALKGYQFAQKTLNQVKKVGVLTDSVEKLQQKLFEKHASPDYVKLSPSMRETFKLVINRDLSPLLPQIAAPTLLVWGTADTETPLWMGEKMEKEIPDAALIPFENRSHFAFAEEPLRFQLIVKAFFEEEKSA